MINISHICKSVMTLLGVITLFACEGNYKNVQELGLADNLPFAEGRDVNLKYTDSGLVVANLKAPFLKDYSNFDVAFREFPDGVELYFWKDDKMSTIKANYAMQFEDSGLVDLRDNVRVITHDSVLLDAEQLYWDQKRQWVFTDKPYKITLKDGSVNNGASFDANQDFTIFISRNNKGVQLIDKKQKLDGE